MFLIQVNGVNVCYALILLCCVSVCLGLFVLSICYDFVVTVCDKKKHSVIIFYLFTCNSCGFLRTGWSFSIAASASASLMASCDLGQLAKQVPKRVPFTHSSLRPKRFSCWMLHALHISCTRGSLPLPLKTLTASLILGL